MHEISKRTANSSVLSHTWLHACCSCRDVQSEGAIFHLGEFVIGRCPNLYKIVIRFLPATTIVHVTEAGPTIDREKFMLRNHDHLQALANTNLELPVKPTIPCLRDDVVGQIRFVQGTNLHDPTSKERYYYCHTLPLR